MHMRIGIDLGGTKIEGIALDDDGTELLRHRVPSPRDSYERTLEAIAGLSFSDLESRARRDWDGRRRHTWHYLAGHGLVKNSNSTWMNGRPLADDLPRLARPASAVRQRCELLCAVGGDRRRGCGSPGRLRRDPRHRHRRRHRRQRPGARRSERDCRRVGAQSDARATRRRVAGAALLLRPHRMHRVVPVRARDWRATTQPQAAAWRRPPKSPRRAATGDAVAEACLARYEDRLARALSGVINVLDPDVIVLGGGLSNVDRLLTSVPTIWRSHIFSDAVATRLVRAVHGDSSGVRGAAWLWD